MAELEMLTIVPPEAGDEPRQVGRRHTLPLGQPLRVGQQASEVEYAIPEDRSISRFHATLRWDGRALRVEERPALPPKFPTAPRNRILFNGQPVRACAVAPGDTFFIGRTRFTLHGDPPVEGTVAVPHHEQQRTRTDLERVPFEHPGDVLKALEKLPDVFRLATNERTLIRQMLKILLAAAPRAEAVGVVAERSPGDAGGETAAVYESLGRVRGFQPSPAGLPAGGYAAGAAAGGSEFLTLDGHWPLSQDSAPCEFQPSLELVRRAIRKQVIVAQHWPPEADVATIDLHRLTATRWAICAPLQDGSRQAVYLTGEFPRGDHAAEELTGYQKVAGLIAGLLEVTRQTHKLTWENSVLRQSLPSRLARLLDDPAAMKGLLDPKEADVTVIFGDLRGYTRHVERNDGDLLQAWAKVSATLNDLSRCVTLCDGVVIRIQGDAVVGCWGWPDAQHAEVANAARAALQIRREFFSRGDKGMRCGLGLASGRAVAGRLGAHDLAEIDLYGPVVNLAARLESMTKAFGVGVLVCEKLAAQLGVADPTGREWRTRRLGRVRVKGLSRRLSVFELLPANAVEARDAVLSCWQAAVDDFTAGRWAEASERLEDYFPHDPAAACLLREMDRTARMPPADWDGTFKPAADDRDDCRTELD